MYLFSALFLQYLGGYVLTLWTNFSWGKKIYILKICTPKVSFRSSLSITGFYIALTQYCIYTSHCTTVKIILCTSPTKLLKFIFSGSCIPYGVSLIISDRAPLPSLAKSFKVPGISSFLKFRMIKFYSNSLVWT